MFCLIRWSISSSLGCVVCAPGAGGEGLPLLNPQKRSPPTIRQASRQPPSPEDDPARLTGAPQCGQAFACLLTSPLQSLHRVVFIDLPTFKWLYPTCALSLPLPRCPSLRIPSASLRQGGLPGGRALRRLY